MRFSGLRSPARVNSTLHPLATPFNFTEKRQTTPQQGSWLMIALSSLQSGPRAKLHVTVHEISPEANLPGIKGETMRKSSGLREMAEALMWKVFCLDYASFLRLVCKQIGVWAGRERIELEWWRCAWRSNVTGTRGHLSTSCQGHPHACRI